LEIRKTGKEKKEANIMTNHELAKRFAKGATSGVGSNMFIDGDTIYSYGRHFPIAKRLSPTEYLYNPLFYSMTTRRHQGRVITALYAEGHSVYEAPNCDEGRVIDHLKWAILGIFRQYQRARTRRNDYKRQLQLLISKIEDYIDKFGGQKPVEISEVKKEVLENVARD